MWIWRWWYWLCGYVVFEAQGGLCERFLGLVSEEMPLWNVHHKNDTLTATCFVWDYKRLRSAARRTGTRVRHLSQHGAYHWCRPMRKRMGLMVGGAMALALYIVLAGCVWSIDVQVEDAALRHRIEQQLAASGVVCGVRMREVDVATVRMAAIAEIEELHQLSLYFDGCIARVEVRLQEDTVAPPDATPAHIVAAADGRILSAQVTVGQSMFLVGEAVVEGELLVCGAVETEKGILLRHSSAIITAETTREVIATACKEEWRSAVGRTIRQPTLYVFGRRLPLYSAARGTDDWLVTTKEQRLTWRGVRLPIGWDWVVYEEPVEQRVTYTEEQVKALAEKRLEAAFLQSYPDAQITDVSYEGEWNGTEYRLRGVYTCVEDIAKVVPFERVA